MIDYSLVAISILLAALTFPSLYAAYVGPTVADRIVSINVIATKATVLIVLFAVITEQEAFIDVALIYAMMGFIATICISKYIDKGTVL